MNGIGRHLGFFYVVGVGALGCSAVADTEVPPQHASPSDENSATNRADDDVYGLIDLDAHELIDHDTDEAPSSDDVPEASSEEALDEAHPCGCASPIPGVLISENEGDLSIEVSIPNAAEVTLLVSGASCAEIDGGLAITGDVNVDLGGIVGIELLGAELALSSEPDAGSVSITGAASLSGASLGGLLVPLALADLKAGVALDIGAGAGPLMSLELPSAAVNLAAGALPLAGAAVELQNTTVSVSLDGDHELIEIHGWLSALAGAPWLGAVPLVAIDELELTAWIADQSLAGVELNGDLRLDGGSLLCGVTSLLNTSLANGTIVWDAQGLEVRAEIDGPLHPALSLLGAAEITAEFNEDTWGIRMCGAGLLDLGLNLFQALDCLELSTQGIALCHR